MFQSTLPAKGATGIFRKQVYRYCQFQSTLPAKGATSAKPAPGAIRSVSIHAPREGSDLPPLPPSLRPPCFNPRSPRRERRWRVLRFSNQQWVSIHAPREGSDPTSKPRKSRWRVSIHAPRARERRLYAILAAGLLALTSVTWVSTHAPLRRERRMGLCMRTQSGLVSIHAPSRRERRSRRRKSARTMEPRHLGKGATWRYSPYRCTGESQPRSPGMYNSRSMACLAGSTSFGTIHAPRGATHSHTTLTPTRKNPRPQGRERHTLGDGNPTTRKFQSTPLQVRRE